MQCAAEATEFGVSEITQNKGSKLSKVTDFGTNLKVNTTSY